jgi:hypothetical protein
MYAGHSSSHFWLESMFQALTLLQSSDKCMKPALLDPLGGADLFPVLGIYLMDPTGRLHIFT